jgi:hypothetical protein
VLAPRTRPAVAETLLRFQRAAGTKARREAALHAPQPSKARTRGQTGTVGVEQLSFALILERFDHLTL